MKRSAFLGKLLAATIGAVGAVKSTAEAKVIESKPSRQLCICMGLYQNGHCPRHGLRPVRDFVMATDEEVKS